MSILFVHGWQDRLHALGKYDIVGVGFNAETGLRTSRHGTGQVPEFRPARRSNNDRHRVLLDTALSEVAAGAAIYMGSSARLERTLQFRVGDTWLLTVVWDRGTEVLELRAGGASTSPGTLLSSVATSPGNNWYHFQVHAVIDGASSTWEWFVDGLPAGHGTHDLGTDPVTEVTFSGSADGSLSQSNGSRIAYEDGWVTDGELLGDARVVSLRPDGAGSSSDWTPQGSGDNYEEVNELPPDPDTYVFTDTDGDRDMHTMPTPLSDSSRPLIAGVFVNALARRTDTADRDIRLSLRVDGTNYDSDPQEIDGEAVFTEGWLENPDTSSAWQTGDLVGLEAGYVAVKP